MQPALQIGDVIIIKKANNYAEKDIITYDNGLTTITHRIKSIDGDEIITEGDANDAPDKPITKDRILGKYFFRISTFSVFSIMLTGKTIYLIMVLVLFAILLFAISDRVTRNLEYRRNNFKKVIKEKENKEQKKKMPKKKDEMEILAEKLHKETLKMHKKFLNNNK